MRETITRCCRCKREDCDGRMWELDETHSTCTYGTTMSVSVSGDKSPKRIPTFGFNGNWSGEVKEIVDEVAWEKNAKIIIARKLEETRRKYVEEAESKAQIRKEALSKLTKEEIDVLGLNRKVVW